MPFFLCHAAAPCVYAIKAVLPPVMSFPRPADALSNARSGSVVALARSFTGAFRNPLPVAAVAAFAAGQRRKRGNSKTALHVSPSSSSPAAVEDREVVLVVGLDSVICDCSQEATGMGIAAANALWPDTMKAALDIDPRDAGVRQSWVEYDWSRYEAQNGREETCCGLDPQPSWLIEKVKRLRPAVDADWELVLIARLCVEEAVACRDRRRQGSRLARPLSAGEIEANWNLGLRESLLAKFCATRSMCEGAVADQWAACFAKEDAGVRVAAPCHLEVMEAIYVAAFCGAVHRDVYVLSCMDQASATKVLNAAGDALMKAYPDAPLAAPCRRIALGQRADGDTPRVTAGGGWRLMSGLGSVDEAVDAVQQIADRHVGSQVMLVDSSVSVLQAVASRLRLGAVRLHYAAWGPSDRSGVWADARAALPRVHEVREDQLEKLLCRGKLR